MFATTELVALDPIGVPQDEEDADGEPDHEHHQSEHETVADRHAGEPRRDPGGERVDRRAVGADPAPEQDDGGAGHRVVPGCDHHGDDQGVERQALLCHPVRRPAEREDAHQDRDHPPLLAPEPADEAGDPGLDGPGLHRDAEEPADDDDEQGHVDGTEQDAGVVVADVALRVLDAVHAVDRGGEGVHQDAGRVRRNLVVGAWDGAAGLVKLVGACGDDPGCDRHHHDQGEQDRVRRGQGEVSLRLRLGRSLLSHGCLLVVRPDRVRPCSRRPRACRPRAP